MADFLSVSAGAVGIAVPALHAMRILLNDVKSIIDAPKDVERLRNNLIAVEEAYKSLQNIPDAEWTALGSDIAALAKNAIDTCEVSCASLHRDLKRWTKHSNGITLSKTDRVNIGFFKERQLRAISEQLQDTKNTFNNVVSITTLYSNFRVGRVTEETKADVKDIAEKLRAGAVSANDKLISIEDRLDSLRFKSVGPEEDVDDRTGAVRQLEEESAALRGIRTLFEKLAPKANEESIRKAVGAENKPVSVSFGLNYQGMQVNVSNGPIHFGK
ncbi:Hypothetical protein R9X50_00468600 [Acrodontium crateriforme]|uniref:Azaphilone pigments biosynthesis cluster protein L N-terminal domain-containing protein n=1 Tax=Acrodontium crateriforme TaxID=150365 RepID=A0AAQ3MBE3_9PEZI|nr:Hypothetical protein R9X50_00468600 [Acrodontium crateriforme]